MSAAPFHPVDIIRKKREGAELSEKEITSFVRGIANESVGDAQLGAFAMAVFLKAMTDDECFALTCAMRDSGKRLSWPGNHCPIIDKHSTGGVGDKISLMLAPIVAACGCWVPMISGRALGHSGGTLDKLESIPGLRTQCDNDKFQRIVREVGCAIVSASATLAPADNRLYAIRNATATIESLPLITASILSKKLAAGLDGLVLDVKTGSGAFMASLEVSIQLAESLCATAERAGLPTRALVTDMNQVLGFAVGNSLEVIEALDFLHNRPSPCRLATVTTALAAEMLCAAQVAKTLVQAEEMVHNVLRSGQAAEVFARMVAAQGGPTDLHENAQRYFPKAAIVRPCFATQEGNVHRIDTRRIGAALTALGGGRRNLGDKINPSVGFSRVLMLGQEVDRQTPLGIIHAARAQDWDQAAQTLRQAFVIKPEPPPPPAPVIYRSLPASPTAGD